MQWDFGRSDPWHFALATVTTAEAGRSSQPLKRFLSLHPRIVSETLLESAFQADDRGRRAGERGRSSKLGGLGQLWLLGLTGSGSAGDTPASNLDPSQTGRKGRRARDSVRTARWECPDSRGAVVTAAIPARLAAIAAIAVLSAPLVAQRIWTVDWQNRPGTDFTDIQPAVDAAAPGDVVLVRGAGVRIWDPADHGYPAPIIDGKGITIAGEGPDMTWISGAVRIRNVPAGESCTLANLRTGTDYEVSISQPATVFASHCQGTVVFRRVAFLGYGFREFSDCRLVVVSESTMHPVCGVRPIRSKLMTPSGLG